MNYTNVIKWAIITFITFAVYCLPTLIFAVRYGITPLSYLLRYGHPHYLVFGYIWLAVIVCIAVIARRLMVRRKTHFSAKLVSITLFAIIPFVCFLLTPPILHYMESKLVFGVSDDTLRQEVGKLVSAHYDPNASYPIFGIKINRDAVMDSLPVLVSKATSIYVCEDGVLFITDFFWGRNLGYYINSPGNDSAYYPPNMRPGTSDRISEGIYLFEDIPDGMKG